MTATVVVLGSANLDLVFAVPSIPRAGETVLARGHERHCGGKGLNQAIAAARAGVSTGFIGAVGTDDAGAMLTDVLARNGVDIARLRSVDVPTGTAAITVDDHGENAIVVAAGANGTVSSLEPADEEAIAAASVLVAQLEIPLSAVALAAAVARCNRTTVILNASPVQPIDDALLAAVDVVVVNEHEATTLTGLDAAVSAGHRLAERCGAVVLTLGAKGAVSVTSDGSVDSAPAGHATAVDTTGAGDAFTGYLAAGLVEGMSLGKAMRLAVTAGTLSVQRHGAEPSIPHRAEVDASF